MLVLGSGGVEFNPPGLNSTPPLKTRTTDPDCHNTFLVILVRGSQVEFKPQG